MKHHIIYPTRNRSVTAAFSAAAAIVVVSMALSSTSLGQESPIADESIQTKSVRLANQLGDRKFSVRERSMQELFEMGLPAVTALHGALDHPDREVRRRAIRALDEIARRDRPRRLALLTSGMALGELEVKHALFGIPGLGKLVHIAGDTPESRRMLAMALRADWELIEDSTRKDIDTLQLIELTCRKARATEHRHNAGIGPETMVAIITASMLRGQPLPDRISQQVYSLLSQMDPSSTSLSATDTPAWDLESFRRLIGAFILDADGPTAVYQGLKISMEHNLPEGLASAKRIVKGGYSLPHIRQFAILAVARFGDQSHINDLQLLLDDEAVCFTRRRTNERRYFECQVRDLSMAAILHLVGRDPREFGFRHIQTSERYVFQPHTVGFDSVEERETAMARFHVQLASNIIP
jgi:hypothetical protein